ncbi:MAG: hypothetical protein ACJA1A_001115 [Saprospiraceae bacterium]
MTQKKEDIIKELIFETTTREMLVGKSAQVSQTEESSETILDTVERNSKGGAKKHISINNPTKTIWLFTKVAAVAIVILGAIFLMKNQFQDNSTRGQYATSIYTLPTVSKSRGATIDIIDQYINLLDDKKYIEVLSKLTDATSEKDLWIKAHLLFNNGEYAEFTKLVESHEWQDEIYAADIDWLGALMLFRSGGDIAEIEKLYPGLTSEQRRALGSGY